MKQEQFILRNVSKCDGTYKINGEYHILSKESHIIVAERPESFTDNITVSTIIKDVPMDAEAADDNSKDTKKKRNQPSED